jgi:hypothetical protein
MGFFDTVKEKANALASDAGRASKVTAAQARVIVLQSDVRKAERELGHAAFELIGRGELEPTGMADAAARLREAHQALSDKEAEIAAIRAAAGDPQAAADAAGQATTAAEPAPVPEAPGGTSGGGEAGAVADAVAAEAPAAKKPARKPAPRKAAAKSAVAKSAAKKAGGADKTGSAKPAPKKTGGAKAASKSAGGGTRKKPPASSA